MILFHDTALIYEGWPVHKAPTSCGLVRVDVCNLTPTSRVLFPGFESIISMLQGNNITIAPRLTLYDTGLIYLKEK